MQISSPEFKDGETIPEKFTCRGNGVNPTIRINDVPTETQSLVLIVRDPDAPSGDFIHWLLWNISPERTEIAENGMPEEAISGKNSSGSTGFVPPCPPAGIHRYKFQFFALNSAVKLPKTAGIAELESIISDKVIEESSLIGLVGQN